jgi:hypothetical protein
LKIAEEYNGLRGTNLTSQSLSKKLANMKQKERQKMVPDNGKKRSGVGMDDDDVKKEAKV